MRRFDFKIRPSFSRGSAFLAFVAVLGSSFLSAWAIDKNQPKVLAAFRPAIEKVTHGTVRVYCDGKRAALGAVVDADGYILTKASEVRGKIECQAFDGRRSEAKLIGVNRTIDVAMLKVDWKDLPPITWRDDDKLDLGSWVITAGIDRDPVGYGVLSATSRKILPANGALGIELIDAVGGGGVRRVMPESPAEKAGLQGGDVITHVDGKATPSLVDLRKEILGLEPGSRIMLNVRRGEEDLKITAVLGSFQTILNGDRAEFQNSLGGPLSERRAGFSKIVQHDTVLKPTDCGGPLVDLDGKVIGLNIARAGRVETYALSASEIKPLIADFKSGRFAPLAEKPVLTAETTQVKK